VFTPEEDFVCLIFAKLLQRLANRVLSTNFAIGSDSFCRQISLKRNLAASDSSRCLREVRGQCSTRRSLLTSRLGSSQSHQELLPLNCEGDNTSFSITRQKKCTLIGAADCHINIDAIPTENKFSVMLNRFLVMLRFQQWRCVEEMIFPTMPHFMESHF
jgi:hypothetical protein